MDRKLVAWARAVKARRRWSAATRAAPTLFLFLDDRLDDPVGAVASLGLSLGAAGRGLFGVVLRARDAGARAALARRLAPLCRRHDLALVIAGDPRLARAWRAGLHRGGGRRTGAGRLVPAHPRRLVTASAHDVASVRRAQGAALVFVSPVFRTASHPGAPPLGPHRFARLMGPRAGGPPIFALGGIDGATVRRLPRIVSGAGAIGALAPTEVGGAGPDRRAR